MAIIGPTARTIAALCERSTLLSVLLRHARFPYRCRVVSEMRRVPGPRERIAVSHGARYRLDVADILQRDVWFGCYENEAIREAVALTPVGGVCLDVGANIGFFALPLALRVGPVGAVHAFEPDPRNAARLRANAELNGLQDVLRVHEAAVADREGRLTLFGSDEEHSGWGSLTEFKDITGTRVEVQAVTLDSFLAREGIGRVDFLKVDVEAGEMELLEGARESLRGGVFRRVLIEFNGPRMAERGHGFEEFLERFTAAGYRPASASEALIAEHRSGALPLASHVVNLHFFRN